MKFTITEYESLHNLIIEEMDGDGDKGTKNTVSIDPNDKIAPI